MNEQELIQRIEILEYHQKLLIMLLNNPKLDFYKLVIEKGIDETEVRRFLIFCDDLNNKMEEQKAEGFVYFHPLFDELLTSLPPKLNVKEVIPACIAQEIHVPLFLEFMKYI